MGLDYDFVKVLDFGLVKFNDAAPMQHDADDRSTHTTTGTPAFMAPEIILGEADVDRRADVYALGCVAYYLLTGQLVFEADTPMKMFAAARADAADAAVAAHRAADSARARRAGAGVPREGSATPAAERRRAAAHGRAVPSRPDLGPEHGEAWWEKHLPELTGPLSMTERSDVAAPRASLALR